MPISLTSLWSLNCGPGFFCFSFFAFILYTLRLHASGSFPLRVTPPPYPFLYILLIFLLFLILCGRSSPSTLLLDFTISIPFSRFSLSYPLVRTLSSPLPYVLPTFISIFLSYSHSLSPSCSRNPHSSSPRKLHFETSLQSPTPSLHPLTSLPLLFSLNLYHLPLHVEFSSYFPVLISDFIPLSRFHCSSPPKSCTLSFLNLLTITISSISRFSVLPLLKLAAYSCAVIFFFFFSSICILRALALPSF